MGGPPHSLPQAHSLFSSPSVFCTQMDEYQHYERFNTDNDFEGGEWIGDEFFASGQRKGRTQSREEQLYGIFAEDSDDDDGRGRKKKRKKDSSIDLTKPVAFVSHGVTGSSTDKPEDIDKAENQAADRSAGLGFGSSGGGLGFTPAKDPGGGAEEVEMDIADLPTSFGQRILQSAKERQKEKAERDRRKAEHERRQTGKTAGVSQLPSFEQHTKGIGSKLLAAMGYKPGQGLGKDQQGIAAALEAKMRPKNMGMGFNDYDEHKLAKEKAPEKTQPKAQPKAVEPRLWKKGKAAERVKREYRTADEVLAEATEKQTAQPILDMRGPQARLITDMDDLNSTRAEADANATPMPELQHNLRLLVDLAASDIQRIDGKLRHEKDTAVVLGREAERLAGEAAAARAQVERVEQVVRRVEQAQALGASASLDALHDIYSSLQRDFPEEYVMHNLAAVALMQVLPRMAAVMAGAAPFAKPAQGLKEAVQWRPLLESAQARDAIFSEVAIASGDAYAAMLNATVVPAVASAVTNQWEPRDPEPLLAWMEAWKDVLPAGVQISILETLIFPKVARAVEAWEPQAESVPLHAWLHPWLPYLGHRLESLYPTIRFRLATALQAWHPSDSSALALLSPWHRVFGGEDWELLMVRSILPKLAWALSDALVINPADQDLTAWHWVTAWAPVMPVLPLLALLEAHFFPKWHDVLRAWLSQGPDYEEISNWYVNWKAQLPAELSGHERVQAQLAVALSLIDAAMEGRALPASSSAAARDAYTAAAAAAPAPSFSRWGGGSVAQAASEPTLRQMVELFAEQNNLDFVPKAGRRHEGLQVYGFGLVSVVLDNTHNTIRAQSRDGKWAVTTLEEVIEEHRRRAAAKGSA